MIQFNLESPAQISLFYYSYGIIWKVIQFKILLIINLWFD